MTGACCDSCARGGPCAGGCSGHDHAPSHALAPVNATAAGRGLSHLLGSGSRVLSVDCGGLAARMLVEHSPDGKTVRLSGSAAWSDGGRWARAVVEVDVASFHEALRVADAAGGLPRLATMIEKASGHLLGVGLDERPILGRY